MYFALIKFLIFALKVDAGTVGSKLTEVMSTAAESKSTNEMNGRDNTFMRGTVLTIQSPSLSLILENRNPRKISDEVNVVPHSDVHIHSAELGMKYVGMALMRRSSSQELQGIRIDDDISTARSNRA